MQERRAPGLGPGHPGGWLLWARKGLRGGRRAAALEGCTPGCWEMCTPQRGTIQSCPAGSQWYQETPNLAWPPSAGATAISLVGFVLKGHRCLMDMAPSQVGGGWGWGGLGEC